MKILACALKNKIKNKNFLIIKGSVVRLIKSNHVLVPRELSATDPLIISVGFKAVNLRMMSRVP